jgi:hypothetical protein
MKIKRWNDWFGAKQLYLTQYIIIVGIYLYLSYPRFSESEHKKSIFIDIVECVIKSAN